MNNRYTILFILFISVFSIRAQEQAGNREKANEYFVNHEFGKAVILYQKLVEEVPTQLEDMKRLAYSSYQINDYELAAQWYAKINSQAKSEVEDLLNYGRVLKQLMRYDDAKKVFEQYITITGNKDEVELDLVSCEFALECLSAPTNHIIVNEEKINTPRSDFGAFQVDGTVYFTSESSKSKRHSRNGKGFLKMFIASKVDDSLGLPTLFKPFNTSNGYHIGPVSSNASGDVFYVTQTYVDKRWQLDQIGSTNPIINHLELIIFTKNAVGQWSSTAFAHNNPKEYSVAHASLSPDQKVLYFVSDMPGGYGGTDIWFCELDSEGNWGIPQNLGLEINSVKDELFPYLAEDGTLYYSSNGLIGMGGLDIYSSQGSKTQWTTTVNLQHPINSGGDDFSFFIREETNGRFSGYLSSNRQGGLGADDIYSFVIQSE